MTLNHGFDSEADPGDVVGHSQDSARERGNRVMEQFPNLTHLFFNPR